MDLNTKILIVDDLKSVRKILWKLLAEIGFSQIEEAADGQEAYEKIENTQYGLIISDWEMPRMKGMDLLKRLRAEDRFAKLPFIMVTPHSNKETVLQAADSGVSAYICKPFTAQVLKIKLARVLPQKES